jgi:hypothetical protein
MIIYCNSSIRIGIISLRSDLKLDKNFAFYLFIMIIVLGNLCKAVINLKRGIFKPHQIICISLFAINNFNIVFTGRQLAD